jgi:tetratricopeptide (TPR) repeat protein
MARLFDSLPMEQRLLQRSLIELRTANTSAGRAAAASSLGEQLQASQASLLASALHDPDEAVHSAVEDALWSVWGRSGDSAVDTAMEVGMAFLKGAASGASRRDALSDALAAYSGVCDAWPWHAEAHNKRATVLYLLERWREAVSACERVVELNPTHFGALSGAAMCCIHLGLPEEADAWFARALLVNPRLESARSFRNTLAARRRRGEERRGE